MLFEEAMTALRAGGKVRRPGWYDNWKHVEILIRGGVAEVYVLTDDGMEYPYHCNFRTDLLADDWIQLEAA